MLETLSNRYRLFHNDPKTQFLYVFEKAKKEKEPWATDNNQICAKYLHDVHNICVGEDFDVQLDQASNEHHNYTCGYNIPFSVLDSIIVSCSKWKEYLEDSKEVFDRLVCDQVLCMFRIHTSVIAGRNIQNIPGVKLKATPPYLLVTIVTKSGGIKVFS